MGANENDLEYLVLNICGALLSYDVNINEESIRTIERARKVCTDLSAETARLLVIAQNLYSNAAEKRKKTYELLGQAIIHAVQRQIRSYALQEGDAGPFIRAMLNNICNLIAHTKLRTILKEEGQEGRLLSHHTQRRIREAVLTLPENQATTTNVGSPDAYALLDPQASQRRLLSGIKILDDFAHGGLPSDGYIILGGASGVGKTLLAFNFARAAMLRDERVIILSPDMGEQTCARYMAMILMSKNREELADDMCNDKAKWYTHKGCWRGIFPESIVTVDQIDDLLLQVSACEPDLVIIDHLQSFESIIPQYVSLAALVQRISRWSRRKHVPVICLSQVNRGAKDAINDTFRGSSALVEKAEMALVLMRPKNKADTTGFAYSDIWELHVSKNRYGPETNGVPILLSRNACMQFSALSG